MMKTIRLSATRGDHSGALISASDRMVKFIEYIHECPRTGPDWIEAFINFYAKQKPELAQRRACAEKCMARLQERI